MSKLWLSILILLPVATMALEAKPVKNINEVKGYGFNWSGDPTKARCILITSAMINNFKACAYKPEGITDTFRFECPSKKGGSYLIFDTLKQCKDRKAEMEADFDGGG